jgi:hypothetical protein
MHESKPCSEWLQDQLASGREEENSKMEILHESTSYNLCGFDDDKLVKIEKHLPWKIVSL